MHASHLIASILHGKWAIEPLFALAQGPAVANFLNKYVEFERQEPDKNSAYAISPDASSKTEKYSYWDGFKRAPEGSVAVIKIKGVLLKDDQYCGPIGTATMGEMLKAAGTCENIAAIVLHIDSPGGTVDGTEALGNIIGAMEKPVVTFVDGLMASAAFWIGSYADEIIASTDTDEIGSVGVMLQFADMQPYWESMNIRFHSVTASTSPDKNKIWEDLRNGKYDAYRSQVLDKLDEKFMGIIRKNLPSVQDEHLTGRVFFARDLMNMVVDSIGNLDSAISRAAELAKKQSSLNHNQSTNLKSMKQYQHVNAALGVESLEAVDEFVSLNQQQLEALDNQLAMDNTSGMQTRLDEANATIGSLQSGIAELEKVVSAHQGVIAGHEATIRANEKTIAEKDAEIARLKGKAAEGTTTARTGGDDADLVKSKTTAIVSESDDFETAVTKVAEEYLSKY